MGLLFVFDMDDVLYQFDWRVRVDGLTALTGHDLDELRRRWWDTGGEEAAEAGAYPDGAAYHAAWVAAMGVDVPVQAWVANRRSAMTAWPDSIAAVRRAAELGQVSLLTNNGPLVHEYLPELAPEIAGLFGDHLRTTSYYGARKPDPAVFRAVLAAYDAAPDDLFFADDLDENVRAAQSVGITGHLFTSGAAMLAAIDAFAAARLPAG